MEINSSLLVDIRHLMLFFFSNDYLKFIFQNTFIFHNVSEISIIRIYIWTLEISTTFLGLENNFKTPVFHGSPEIIKKVSLKIYCIANLDSILEYHRHFTNTHCLKLSLRRQSLSIVLQNKDPCNLLIKHYSP